MLASGIPLFVFGVEGVWLRIILWAIFLFSLIVLYMLGGHAPLYGPHLFIFGFIELASSVWGIFQGNTRSLEQNNPDNRLDDPPD